MGTWTTTVPTAINEGTYNVYWKLVGDSNHNDVAQTLITASISKNIYDLSNATITLEYSTTTYDGSEKNPNVTVTLVNGTIIPSYNHSTGKYNYYTSYSNNIDVGTARVLVIGENGYSGSQSLTFTITQATGSISSSNMSFKTSVSSLNNISVNVLSTGWKSTTDSSLSGYNILCSEGNYHVSYSLSTLKLQFINNTGSEQLYCIKAKQYEDDSYTSQGDAVYIMNWDYTTEITSYQINSDYQERITNTSWTDCMINIPTGTHILQIIDTNSYSSTYYKQGFVAIPFPLNFMSTVVKPKIIKIGDGSITYSSSNTSVASVSSETITINGTGTATIYMNMAGTTNATAASTSFTLTVSSDTTSYNIQPYDITNDFPCKDSSFDYTVIDTYEYSYTGDVQTVTLGTGYYILQCWGAQGGYRSSSSYGGKGGYSEGLLTLNSSKTMYIYVGGSGNTGGTSGGFNGGGKRGSYNGGGGASDIRIDTDSLYSRVIVAGGGGSDGAASKTGMYGGGTSGGSSSEAFGTGGYGGTQTGVSSTSWQTTTVPTSTTTQEGAYAGFGFGGNGITRSNGYGGAGGGGWYGGSGSYPDGSGDDDRGGGGGSGYVYTSSTASNYPSGCTLNSNYYLGAAQTMAGTGQFFIGPTNTAEKGHEGNGYVKITKVSIS